MQPVNYRLHPVSFGVLCVGLLWMMLTHAPQVPVVVTTTNQVVPDVAVLTADGTQTSPTNVIGRPTIYVMWATWCPSCRAELPTLQQLAPELGTAGVALVLVNQGETPDVVIPWLQTHQITVPVWYDTNRRFANAFQAPDLPTTIFVDAGGVVDLVYRGPVTPDIIDTMRASWQQERGTP